MKTNLLLLIFFTTLSFFSCEEIGPNIILSGGGGNTGGGEVDSSQQKIVLIEEFTATDCPNCPKARDIIDNLLAANPERIEVVEVHQGPLSQIILPGDPPLLSQEGDVLATLLGPPAFWPIGAIDRKSYETSPGTFETLVDRGLWSTYVPQALDDTLKVKLGMDYSYDDNSRQFRPVVTVNFFETISDPLNITVLITESGIVAAQVDGAIIDSYYVHHDVLRKVITNYAGDPINGDKTQGAKWSYTIAPYTLPVEWNADSCRIIAFVSTAAGKYDVLQAIGKPLK